ncbi:hypothetical protein Vadar_026479 [Vaccinium darrowii]|uniref:Uncharacterized protein n=1 Tax=Vaccinium darrowii TaxID=229202 RepID=A0ACB7YPM8_9ERIC|nr:hypothetical protein Vadar_026479 [Vaccinium darrowii]
MKHMMPEVQKVNEMVLDANSECNCPICCTRGLACAHEIAQFKNDGIPLPLYLIDNHWKTLYLEKTKQDASIVQVMEADFSNFLAKVKTFNDKSQRHWLKTIKECLNPSTTSPSDPQQKPKTMGLLTDLYENVSGEKGRAKQLRHRLTYFDDFPAPEYMWMTMPNMGHLIASTYNVALVFLSQCQCLTFLPLLSHPLARQCKVIAIGFVNGNHFVQVYMKPWSPMPLIANNWYKYWHDEAKDWEKPFA